MTFYSCFNVTPGSARQTGERDGGNRDGGHGVSGHIVQPSTHEDSRPDLFMPSPSCSAVCWARDAVAYLAGRRDTPQSVCQGPCRGAAGKRIAKLLRRCPKRPVAVRLLPGSLVCPGLCGQEERRP
jgi:hypothetical protein